MTFPASSFGGATAARPHDDPGRAHALPVWEVTLLPIQPVDPGTLDRICAELRARGIAVHLERPILRPRDSYDARRRQLKADVLLARAELCAARPILALTDADCYAGSLNFVFGMAEVGGSTAVVALHRLHAGATPDTFIARAMKEIFHELGHGCGLRHCTNPRCVMHFSNTLAETDAKGERLCAACLRRIGSQPRAWPLRNP